LSLQKEISNVLSFITANGYQIHPDAFTLLKDIDSNKMNVIQQVVKYKKKNGSNTIIGTDDIKIFCIAVDQNNLLKNDQEIIEKFHTHHVVSSSSVYQSTNSSTENNIDLKDSYKVIFDSTDYINSGEGINGYTSLFKSRFIKSLKILSTRPDSKRINKIAFVKKSNNQKKQNNNLNTEYNDKKKENNNTSLGGYSSVIAGLVMSKRSKRNSTELTIDDQTGIINTLAVTDETIKLVSKLTLDQMVMVEVENKGNNHIIKNVVSPDIPDHIPNKGKRESYVVLISDLHVGSKYFKETDFLRFLNWLNSSDDEIVSKIKFLCIGGDLIDGVGIFPNQDKELKYNNTFKQMSHLTKLLEEIPKRIQVFIIPGNHDLGRRALPQPAVPKNDCPRLYSFENFTMLGNPSFIELEGVKILMYHGQGLDDIIATIPGLSYANPAEAMKILLKARHLSPIYGQRTPISPELEDMMVINEVPDVFHSGHVHVMDVQNYRGTLIINSGTWQDQTPFQQTMGIMPTSGIAILVNLATLRPFQITFNQEYASM
jgi:DNA polymerase II small subunit